MMFPLMPLDLLLRKHIHTHARTTHPYLLQTLLSLLLTISFVNHFLLHLNACFQDGEDFLMSTELFFFIWYNL